MKRNTLIAAIATTLFSAAALAHGGFGPGQGPGYGMHGHGPGYAMGPGPGMGAGMGPGMMRGGGGAGPGACMDPADMASLGLSAEQREKIAAIQKEVSAKQLSLMGSMQELRNEAFRSGEPRTGKNQEAMADLRKQMFEATREGRTRIDAILTPEQRAQWRPGWRGASFRG